MVLGASDRALEMYRVKLQSGRFIDPADLKGRGRVCVVGFEIWQELMGAPTDLRGKSIRIGTSRCDNIFLNTLDPQHLKPVRKPRHLFHFQMCQLKPDYQRWQRHKPTMKKKK